MNVAVTLPPPQAVYCYPPDGMAGKLERHLKGRNLHFIGDMNKWLKGAEGPGAFPEPSDNERATRTLHMRRLSERDVKFWHAMERKYRQWMYFWVIRRSMKDVEPDTPDHFNLTEQQVRDVSKFNYKNCPPLREFEGYKIPPYFLYDCDFDGMAHNHQWDWLVRNASEQLVMSAGKKKVSDGYK